MTHLIKINRKRFQLQMEKNLSRWTIIPRELRWQSRSQKMAMSQPETAESQKPTTASPQTLNWTTPAPPCLTHFEAEGATAAQSIFWSNKGEALPAVSCCVSAPVCDSRENLPACTCSLSLDTSRCARPTGCVTFPIMDDLKSLHSELSL